MIPYTRGTLLFRAIVVIGIFHLIAMLVYSYPERMARTDYDRDLFAYYSLVERMHKGQGTYSGVYEKGPHSAKHAVYQYPPVLSSALNYLPQMSFDTFAKLWTTMLYVCFWIYAACLAKINFQRFTFVGLIVAGLFLTLFPGTHMALSLGQIDPLLWAFMGIAITIPSIRGGALMLISLIKPWAIIPLFFVLKEDRRSVVTASIVAFFCLVLGVISRGVQTYYNEWIFWLTHILPSLGQGSWSAGNWSVSFGLLRLLEIVGFDLGTGGMLPVWARIWLLFCGFAVPLLVGFYWAKKNLPLRIAVTGSCAVVFAPLCWITYLPIVILVLAMLVRGRWHEDIDSYCLVTNRTSS